MTMMPRRGRRTMRQGGNGGAGGGRGGGEEEDDDDAEWRRGNSGLAGRARLPSEGVCGGLGVIVSCAPRGFPNRPRLLLPALPREQKTI